MPWFRLVIELAALGLGAWYLYFKHRQRWRAWRPREDPREWTGHGIEAAGLKVRVEQVRRDYLSARQAERGGGFHRHLLRFSRRFVMRLEFFRRREREEHAYEVKTL